MHHKLFVNRALLGSTGRTYSAPVGPLNKRLNKLRVCGTEKGEEREKGAEDKTGKGEKKGQRKRNLWKIVKKR